MKPVLSLVCWLLLVVSAAATQRYVATTGTDTGTCTSAASPCLTIQYGYNQLAAGDTLNVAPGTYQGTTAGWGLNFETVGSAGSPITVKSTVPRGATIDLTNTAGRVSLWLYGAAYNIIDGFKITNAYSAGIQFNNNALNNTIRNNEIYANGPTQAAQNCSGIYVGDGSNNPIIENNFIHDNGDTGSNYFCHGIYLGANTTVVDGAIIRNNIIYHNMHGAGIQIHGSTNTLVYNNTISGGILRGIVIWDTTSGPLTNASNNLIKNNILSFNGSYGIAGCNPTGTGNVIDHNVSFGNALGYWLVDNCGSDTWPSNTITNFIQVDPQFVNQNADFHLQGGSPAIGSGLNLAPTVMTDLEGNPRSPPYDMGAYAFTTGSSNWWWQNR